MRKAWMAGGAVALALGLVGLVRAGDENREKYDMKNAPGCVEGAVVKLYKSEKLIEFKVEKILSKSETDKAPAPRDDERKPGEKVGDTLKGEPIREGQVIFLHVEDCRVFDEKGNELKRDDKSAWFTKDQGWSALKDGMRLKVDYTGTHLMPAPKEFPKDARAGGNILVYHVEAIHILAK